jgi:hypothetical protein
MTSPKSNRTMSNWIVGKRTFAARATLIVLAGLTGADGVWRTRRMNSDAHD